MPIYHHKKNQAPQPDGRMRIQCAVSPSTYSKLIMLSEEATLTDTLIRLIEQEHARVITPAVLVQRKARIAADDAVHARVMAALTGAQQR